MKTQTLKTRALLAATALVALIAAPPARADYSNTVVSQSPVGYWRLSETTASPPPVTTAVNLGSSAAGNGTYNGSSGFFRGLPGALASSDTAIHMDGAAQTVTVPYNADQNPAANFTIECWLKADVSGTQCPISIGHFASPRAGWLIYQVSSTGYELRMYNTNTTAVSVDLVGSVANVVGVWTHVVATFDGTTARLYLNGAEAASGTPTLNLAGLGYVPGTDGQFSLGMRSDTGFPWAGGADEVAFYPSVLTAAEIATHYAAASTNAATYVSFVTGKSPLLYMRLDEAGNTSTANVGTSGAAGEFTTGITPGQAGPRPATFPGFDSLNYAVGFSGVGSVALAPLNLNTNTVTISCWVNPEGLQKLAAGLVVCDAGGTVAGLTMDPVSEGYGLGYRWAGDRIVSFTADLGLPPLQDSTWSYAALVITPTNATIYVCDANNAANWASATDNFNANNANQLFSAATLVGMDGAFTNRNFVGKMDEVTIFNRSLGQGELYTQYATALGGIAPRIFTDIQGPVGSVAVGDPIVLTMDAGGTGPLTFTWRKNTVTVGVTSSNSFVIPTAALADTGNYDVVISNGSGSETSGQVSVTVVVPTTPTIVSTVGFNNRTLYKTATLKLGVTATGGGLKYNWFKNNVLVSSGVSSTFIIASVTNSDAGSYSVSITNSAGLATNGPVAIAIPVKATNTYEGVMITAAPEAWWRLDEASGSVGTPMVDAMGRHDGYYTNAAGGVTIPTLGAPGALTTNLNTAATFTSSSQGIGLVPFSPALNPGKHSIEAWVKTSVIDGQVPVSTFYNSKGSWMQSRNVTGVGQWWGGNNNGVFGNNLNVNTNDVIVPGFWCHVVILYDESVQSSGTFYPYRLYVNGQTDGYIWGDGGSGVNAAGPLIIGARGVSAASLADMFFDGQVDEVAVYQRVLSAAEIQSHFAARGSVVIPPTLSQPLSQTVIAGKTVTFSSTVSGNTPSLRWYKGASPITGATSSTYSLTNVSVADSGTYTLWATNSAGTNSVSATLTVISPVQYANVTNNLVLHLPFDGSAADTSGRGNNATPVGSPTFVTAAIGSQAFHFDTAGSTRNYATLGATIPPDLAFGSSVNFSVSYWIRLPAAGLPGDLPILCSAANSYGNPGITIAPSYKLGGWSWYLNNTGLYGADGSINDGNWHNLIHTFDRTGNGLTYLDGILVNSTVITGVGNLDQAGAMNIGQDATGAYPEDAAMDLDDLGIWRRVITPSEAASIESAGRAGRSFNTVAPASVTLTISSSGGNVVVGYPSGTLQQSDSVGSGAVWTTVSGASAPSYTTSPTNATKFYRVLVQ